MKRGDVAIPIIKVSVTASNMANRIDSTRLIEIRQSLVAVIHADNERRGYSKPLGKMVYVFWMYGCRNSCIPKKWLRLVWEHSESWTGKRIRLAEFLLLSANAIPIFGGTELWHEQLSVWNYVSDGMANILKRHLDLKSRLHSDIGSIFVWTDLLKTEAANNRNVPPWLHTDDFYPWSLTGNQRVMEDAGLLSRFVPNFGANASVDGSSDEGEPSSGSKPHLYGVGALVLALSFSLYIFWRIQFRSNSHLWLQIVILFCCFCAIAYAVYVLLDLWR